MQCRSSGGRAENSLKNLKTGSLYFRICRLKKLFSFVFLTPRPIDDSILLSSFIFASVSPGSSLGVARATSGQNCSAKVVLSFPDV